EANVITRLAREFSASRGCLALAGGIAAQHPVGAEIVAAVNILNYVAGQVGKTVKFGPDHALGGAGSFRDLTALAAEMSAGQVALLLVHGANPAHSLPAAFSQALGRVRYKVSFSSYLGGTAAAADLALLPGPSPPPHDGRGANKPWLQELPDPVSKITWHAWVEVHPETAAHWGVVNGDVVLLPSPHGTVRAPVWVTPGIRPDTVAVPIGQGHKAYGRYARDRSFNAFE